MRLDPRTVKRVVVGWNVMFCGKKSEAELAFFCGKVMHHLLPVFSNEQFLVAADMVERETSFFPTIKQLLELKESAFQAASQQLQQDLNQKRLAEQTVNLTPEEVERNLQHLEIIKRMLAGDLSMDEAVSQQDRIKFFAQGDAEVTQ